jgi:hypothetical protein
MFYGGSIVIDGPSCEVGGGVLNGDIVNNTVGITISSTATDTVITPMRLGQFTSAGIQFTSTPPATRCTIDGVKFKSIHGGAAGYEIVGSTGLPGSILGVSGTSAALPPIITSCQSDVPYLFAAAATGSVTVSPGRQIMQVTASANITNITNVSDSFRITIQAGSGGITFTNAGNIGLITSPLTVAAFTTVSFINYGNFWFVDGKEI